MAPIAASGSLNEKKFRLSEVFLWHTIKPKRSKNGFAGKKRKKRNSENWVWMRTPSSGFIHTIGRSLRASAGFWNGGRNGPPDVEWIAAKDVELPSETADNLLDSIENSQLFQVLQSADKHTLQIILLKLEGYSSREIARLLGIDEYAVNMRIYRLRKKLKKYF
jgi:RNA polymerase sigma factor (sigma-70 family)